MRCAIIQIVGLEKGFKLKLKKILSLTLILILSLTIFTACGNRNIEEESTTLEAVELNISAASSLREAMPEIMEAYTSQHPNVTFIGTYDSSGNLQTQIEAGAPCDVFVSAANKQMTTLDENGFIISSSKINLLQGKLVLIVPSESTLNLESFEDVAKENVELVAIGDNTSTPVGQYTQTVLTNLGIWDKVSQKINFGTNVANVLAWVESGDVDCGFVYATDAATSDKVTIICEAPASSAEPIVYPAAVIKTSENEQAAQEFLSFLKSDTAVSIFEKYGFEMYSE